MSAARVLYDAPGPRARALYRIASVVVAILLVLLGWFVYRKFDEAGQWEGSLWEPFTEPNLWNNFIIPGLVNALKAFAVATVLALAFGFVFGVGRMSTNPLVRWASGLVVEFFRSIPLLILMFFIYYMQRPLGFESSSAFWAVVLGLMLYNGSVLAEVIRAGVNALPRGQREAGLAVGLTRGQAMRSIELPQGVRSMLPAIIAQLVVLLKDTALGYIIGFDELLNQVDKISNTFGTLIPAAIVVAAIYIVLNLTLGQLATFLERRLSRSKKARGGAPVDPGTLAIPGGAAAGPEGVPGAP